jgi:hypothetical protein
VLGCSAAVKRRNGKRKGENVKCKLEEERIRKGKGRSQKINNIDKQMKSQTISKTLFFSFILLGLVLIFLVLSHQTILMKAGKYLAPEGKGKADVVILEGAEFIKEKPVRIGLGLLSSGMASHLVVVIQQNLTDGKIFALPNYSGLLTDNLEGLGLEKDDFQIIIVPTNHPVTLTEAKIVLSDLSKSGARSAILLSEGFHTRRSFWTYKKVGKPLRIEIIPHPYFIEYQNENWWQQILGIQHFVYESLKFFYYILKGYIPVKSLLVT